MVCQDASLSRLQVVMDALDPAHHQVAKIVLAVARGHALAVAPEAQGDVRDAAQLALVGVKEVVPVHVLMGAVRLAIWYVLPVVQQNVKEKPQPDFLIS